MAINPFQDEVDTLVEEIPQVEEPERKPQSQYESLDNKKIGESLAKDSAFYFGNKPTELATEYYDEFAKANNITAKEAQRLLHIYSPEDAKAILSSKTMAEDNMPMVEWGTKEKNYPFYRDNIDNIGKLSQTTQAIRPRKKQGFVDDMKEAFYRNVPMLENALAVGLYSSGGVTREELGQMLRNIDERRKTFTPYGTDMQGLNDAMKEFDLEVAKNIKTWDDIALMPKEDAEDYVRTVIKGSQLAGSWTLDTVDFAWSAVTNPKATTLKSIESAGSTLGPTAMTVIGGGLGGLVGGLPGAAIGAGSAISGSAYIRYAQEFNEGIQEYRRQDGTIDYDAILNDEEAMAKIKNIALKYGIVGGVLDTAFTRLGGRIFKKNRIGQFGVDVAGEGGAEGGATVTKELAKGKSFGEAAGEAGKQAVIESVLVAPTSGTMSLIPGVNSTFRNRLLEAKKKLKAKEKRDNKIKQVKEIRKAAKPLLESEDGQKKFEELWDDVIQPPSVTEYDPIIDEPTPELPPIDERDIEEAEAIDRELKERAEKKEETPEVEEEPAIEEETPVEKETPEVEEETSVEEEPPVEETPSDEEIIEEFKEEPDTPIEDDSVVKDDMEINVEQIQKRLGDKYRGALDKLSDEARESWNAQVQAGVANVSLPIRDYLIMTAEADEDIDDATLFIDEDNMDVFDEIEEDDYSGLRFVPVDETKKPKEKKPDKKKKEKAKKPEKEEAEKILSRFRNEEERQVYNDIRRTIRKMLGQVSSAAGGKDLVDPKTADAYADMVFAYYRRRSEITNEPIAIVAKNRPIVFSENEEYGGVMVAPWQKIPIVLKMDRTLKEGGFRTKDETKKGILANTTVRGFTIGVMKKADPTALIHELAHGFLEDMALDWEFIHSIPYDKLTEAQKDYKRAMKYVEMMLGSEKIKNLAEAFVNYKTDIHEKFAQAAEKFILNGEFQDINTARAMYIFQKYASENMMEHRTGRGYSTYGNIAPQPSRHATNLIGYLMGRGKLIEEAVYPLIPVPSVDPALLGPDWDKYVEDHKKAVDTVMAKINHQMIKKELNAFKKSGTKVAKAKIDKWMEDHLNKEDFHTLKLHFEENPHLKLNESAIKELYYDEVVDNVIDAIDPSFIDKTNNSLDIVGFKSLGILSETNAYAIIDVFIEASNYDKIVAMKRYNAIRMLDPNLTNIEQIEANAKAILSEENEISKVRQRINKAMAKKLLKETFNEDILEAIRDKRFLHKDFQRKAFDYVVNHPVRATSKGSLNASWNSYHDRGKVPNIQFVLETGKVASHRKILLKKETDFNTEYIKRLLKRAVEEKRIDAAVGYEAQLRLNYMLAKKGQAILDYRKKVDETWAWFWNSVDYKNDTDLAQITLKTKEGTFILDGNKIYKGDSDNQIKEIDLTEDKQHDEILEQINNFMNTLNQSKTGFFKWKTLLQEAALRAKLLNFVLMNTDIGPESLTEAPKVPASLDPKLQEELKDTLITNPDGTPEVVFRGGTQPIRSKGKGDWIFFSNDRFIAETYASQGDTIVKGYLNLKNILQIDADSRNWNRISGSAELGNISINGEYYNTLQEAFEERHYTEEEDENISYESYDTDQITQLAQWAGFDGVAIYNVIDSANTDRHSEPSDVFVAFSPEAFIEENRIEDFDKEDDLELLAKFNTVTKGEDKQGLKFSPVKDDDLVLPPTPEEAHEKWKDSLKPIVGKILEEVKEPDETIKQRKKPKGLLQMLINNSLESVNIYNHIASLMTEKELAGSWLMRLFHKVLTQESKRQVHLKRAIDKISKAAQKIPETKSALAKGVKQKDFKTGNGLLDYISSLMSFESSHPVAAPELGQGVQFENMGQVIAAILYTGSKSGKDKFLQGGFFSNNEQVVGISEEQWNNFIQRLVNEGILTREHFEFVQEIHNAFNEIYPLVHKSFQEVEGWDIGFVKPLKQKIKFPDGTVLEHEGGYYPLMTDSRIPREGDSFITKGEDGGDQGFDAWYPAVDISMGRGRRDNIYPIDLNLGRLFNLLGNHYTNAYLKRPLRAVDVVMKDPRIIKRLESRQEGFYDDLLKPWLNRVVRQQYTKRDHRAFGKFANFARRSIYTAMFFGNLKSMGKQFLGFIQAMPHAKQYVGRDKLLKHVLTNGVGSLSNPFYYKKLFKEISDASPYMKNRLDNFQENMVKGLDELKTMPSKIDKAQDWSQKWAFIGIQYTQNITDMAVWKAAMEKQLEEGKTQEEAIAYADLAVLRTQSGSQVSTVTNAQFKTPFERLAYMITMVVHGLRGQIHETRSRARDAGKYHNLATAYALIYFSILPMMTLYGFSSAYTALLGDEEDEEDLKRSLGADQIAGTIIGEMLDIWNPLVARFVVPVFTPGRKQDFMGMGPANYPLRKTQRAATAVTRWWNDGIPFTAQDWDNLATGATITTGLPFVIGGDGVLLLEAQKPKGQKKREAKIRQRALKKARKNKK